MKMELTHSAKTLENKHVKGIPVYIGDRCYFITNPRLCYYDEDSIPYIDIETYEVDKWTVKEL